MWLVGRGGVGVDGGGLEEGGGGRDGEGVTSVWCEHQWPCALVHTSLQQLRAD